MGTRITKDRKTMRFHRWYFKTKWKATQRKSQKNFWALLFTTKIVQYFTCPKCKTQRLTIRDILVKCSDEKNVVGYNSKCMWCEIKYGRNFKTSYKKENLTN